MKKIIFLLFILSTLNIFSQKNTDILVSGPGILNAVHSLTVYLENNVRNRKIQAVYNQNALKRWLMQKKESPTTRKAIESWNSVKRVPEKIMRRYGSNVYWAIQDAKQLQELKKTKLD